MCSVLDWAVFITELTNSGAEPYARKIVKRLYCYRFAIKTIQDKLKSVTSFGKLVQEKSG